MPRLLRHGLLLQLLLCAAAAQAAAAGVIQGEGITVHYEKPLGGAAREVVDLYPRLKSELEASLGWDMDFRPKVLLLRDGETFQRMAGNDLIVAFASPGRNLIVIDYSRTAAHPITLETTLRHELAHLLLHRHIKGRHLPRWLDEGVSQWVSGGIGEMVSGTDRRVLKEAVLRRRFIPLRALTVGFPAEERDLRLAYEESRSIVEFIEREFGTRGLLDLLGRLKDGDGPEEAVVKSLSVSIAELERRWHDHLLKRITWFSYLSNNIYGILFTLAALLTVIAFLRLLLRKRAYRDEDDEEGPGA